MTEICKQKECTGCAACFNSCNHGAITMEPDECGYLYPSINQEKCIDCGLCKKACPVNSLQQLLYPIDSIAATVVNDEELIKCASGGIATLLSHIIIKYGGVVYGCDGTDIRNVHHERKETFESLNDLKGSKYVQSSIGTSYKMIKKDLLCGRKVLFLGTPCQVAGLYGYLQGKKYENLITVDLVCHGVPSQKMLSDNLNCYSKEEDFVDVKFREKWVNPKNESESRIKYCWNMKISKTQDIVKVSPMRDPFMIGFLSCLTIRENCYTCRYACIARVADITLSDYWGLSDNSQFDKGKGVSNVLINTEKGLKLWNECSENAKWERRTIVEALSGNGQLQAPSARHPKHEKFVKIYPVVGFKAAVKKCSYKFLLIHYLKSIYKMLM